MLQGSVTMPLILRFSTSFFIVVVLLSVCPQPTHGFEQAQPTAPVQSGAASTLGRGAEAFVMRVRALRFLGRDKEALDLYKTATPDVRAGLKKYMEDTPGYPDAQSQIEHAQRFHSSSRSLFTLGEYDASVRDATETIRVAERANEVILANGDKVNRVSYVALSLHYKERAVARNAAGDRSGSQRDFQTALELCRQFHCEPWMELDMYMMRALSSFLSSDLSAASDDCRVILRIHGDGARTQSAEEICGYLLSSTRGQTATGQPDK